MNGPLCAGRALARIANDGLAEICRKYPCAFPAFIAALPLNDIDASVREMDRAIGALGARGVLHRFGISTDIPAHGRA
jgi:predicted TIM-barrel fold metal-dependent hydrolase